MSTNLPFMLEQSKLKFQCPRRALKLNLVSLRDIISNPVYAWGAYTVMAITLLHEIGYGHKRIPCNYKCFPVNNS